jgi:type IV secretion system protein VirB9
MRALMSLRSTAAIGAMALAVIFPAAASWSDDTEGAVSVDARIRIRAYQPDIIYRLKAYVGYQIDLQFEPGERFVSLGAGDMESLTFAAQENHVFIKPRAVGAETNITILTNLRAYQFDYVVGAVPPAPDLHDVIYALRFTYPHATAETKETDSLERKLTSATEDRPHNLDYGYCGSPGLKPQSAWDDGVQTHLRFAPRQELPVVFVRNDDGSESLVNATIKNGDVVVQRIARQFIARRGRLSGSIVNRAFSGNGERLGSGTIAPDVRRVTRDGQP